ncbi:GNAT family N-acetyltransferase [Nocardioides terrisoli]|uniref:GNAT family N-acetyltransferase n=1 Tax=Nocardioides terrisoli TaxID=3388267 RepID=UPI00287B6BFA|nr:GNAT family N-acetyltransferase [Nocardioides marmorisolisilvae]
MPVEPIDLSLRTATTADLTEIAELYLATRAAAVPHMPPVADTPGDVRSWVSGWRLTGPGAREVWVAETDLGLVGFASLEADWLDGLYVGPDHQGTGVGSALLDVVRAQRPRGFGLWVFASNTPARAFYRRHGLIELEHTDGSGNQERSPDVRMVWPGNDPLAFLRAQVDAADAELAEVLARRLALTMAIQGHKEQAGADAGHAGRDREREQEIVARMARHAPGLPAELIAPVMEVVIGESLSAWEGAQR